MSGNGPARGGVPRRRRRRPGSLPEDRALSPAPARAGAPAPPRFRASLASGPPPQTGFPPLGTDEEGSPLSVGAESAPEQLRRGRLQLLPPLRRTPLHTAGADLEHGSTQSPSRRGRTITQQRAGRADGRGGRGLCAPAPACEPPPAPRGGPLPRRPRPPAPGRPRLPEPLSLSPENRFENRTTTH